MEIAFLNNLYNSQKDISLVNLITKSLGAGVDLFAKLQLLIHIKITYLYKNYISI